MKIFWRRITSDPTSRLVPSALAIIPPVTKNLATALGNAKKILCHFEIPFKSREKKGDLNTNFRLSYKSARAFLHQLSSKHRQHRDP